ncbi:GntR family transcriptional regulator [Mailhella massiliensis]|uniref:GntR family transcriptional regulator n=1 Tax=Mailhella massiliensis TaxID=1903261 RepID=UPI0023535AA9|nr:GntR family transcriptional regulator [Mailhella massiliensis]
MSKKSPLARTVGEELLKIMRALPEGARRLPSEEELCGMLEVSRATLREALSLLDRAGFITKRHGVGNIVNPSVLSAPMRFDAEVNLRRMLESGGGRADTIRLAPWPEREDMFGEAVSARVTTPRPWIVQRSEHTLNDAPAVLTFNIFPGTGRLLDEAQVQGLSYGELVGAVTGEELSHTVTAFHACPAWRETVAFFGMKEGEAMVYWHQRSFGLKDDLLCESLVFFNPGLVTLHSFNRWE